MPTVRYTTLNGRIVSEKRGGTRKFYKCDPLGSTIGLYDDTQTRTNTFKYWSYDELRSGDASATPFLFVGSLGYHRDSAKRA